MTQPLQADADHPARAGEPPAHGWRPPGVWPHIASWLTLAAVGALLFAQSYAGWGDIVIDLGRDLFLPGELLKGRVLYRELLYNYGPVAPYLLAGVQSLFGDGLRVFAAVGLLCGAAVTAGLYVLGWFLGGLGGAFASALLFLVLSCFANSTWGCNFVLPYSHAAVLGTGFAVWSVVFLVRYLYQGRRGRDGLLAVALLFLAVFTKQDTGLAVAAVYAAAWPAHRIAWRSVLKTLLTGLGLSLAFVAFFAARSPQEHALFRENLLRFGGTALTDSFFLQIAGLGAWRKVLGGEFAALAGPALVLLGVVLLAAARERARGDRSPWPPTVLGLAAPLPLLLFPTLRSAFGDVRILGIAVWLALAFVLAQAARRPRDPLLLLGVFVLFSAPRILLSYHPLWYGFYLFVPAYPFLVALLGLRLPRLLPAPRVFQTALALLGLLVLLHFEAAIFANYRAMTSRLVTAKGTMRDFPTGRTEAVGELLAYLDRNPRARAAGMVVFPEGVSLNYFAGIPNPTAYYLFTPPETNAPPDAEERMLLELSRARPGYVIFISRDVGEFGVRGFGVDYAVKISRWVQENYRIEKLFLGPGQPPFQVVLLARVG